jgi:type IV pilus assembly protein PilO
VIDRGQIWRLRLWVWLPALIFFLANAVAFSVYRFGYAGRIGSLEEDLGRQRQELEPLERRRSELQALVTRVKTNRDEVERLYDKRFATRSQRLTRFTAEVKDLASAAGLEPASISYPEEEIEDYGLVKRSFVFTVEGTYLELRKFINLLEISGSFLALEGLSLTEGVERGPELRINVRISTFFVKGDEGGAVPAAEGGAR